VSADRLVIQLSYNHLELLVDIDDALKRRFYEIECLPWQLVGARIEAPDS
jgi:hypothetical protein